MMARRERSLYQRAVVSSCRRQRRSDGGFSLVEVLVAMLILTIGMIAIAALLAVTTQMAMGAREAPRSTRLAQDKVDELWSIGNNSGSVGTGLFVVKGWRDVKDDD